MVPPNQAITIILITYQLHSKPTQLPLDSRKTSRPNTKSTKMQFFATAFTAALFAGMGMAQLSAYPPCAVCSLFLGYSFSLLELTKILSLADLTSKPAFNKAQPLAPKPTSRAFAPIPTSRTVSPAVSSRAVIPRINSLLALLNPVLVATKFSQRA